MPEADEVQRGRGAQDCGAVAETIENNMRRLIIDEMSVNPKLLREDVATTRCSNKTAQEGSDELQSLSCSRSRVKQTT